LLVKLINKLINYSCKDWVTVVLLTKNTLMCLVFLICWLFILHKLDRNIQSEVYRLQSVNESMHSDKLIKEAQTNYVWSSTPHEIDFLRYSSLLRYNQFRSFCRPLQTDRSSHLVYFKFILRNITELQWTALAWKLDNCRNQKVSRSSSSKSKCLQ